MSWDDILLLSGRREIRGRVRRSGKGGDVCSGCDDAMPAGAIVFVLIHAAPRGTIVSSPKIATGNASPPSYVGVACPDCMDILRQRRGAA